MNYAEGAESLRERKKQQARDRLYDAALELLAQKPYEAVSVEDICKRAEVGRASFFRFFGSKAGLVVEFNRRLAERARQAGACAPELSAAERLRVVQRTGNEMWASIGTAMQAVTYEFLRTTPMERGTERSGPEFLALLTEIVRDGQKTGEITKKLSAKTIANLIFTALGTVTVQWFRNNDPIALETATGNALDILLSGMLR